MLRQRCAGTLMVLTLCGACLVVGSAAGTMTPEMMNKAREYGVSRAYEGDLAAAESVFTVLLAQSPDDARVLVNLGNVQLLRGKRELALAYYDRANRADTADAGARLDLAALLFLMGQDDLAESTAAAGVALAGGEDRASAILGLRLEDRDTSPRAGDMSARFQFPMRRQTAGMRVGAGLGGLVGGRVPTRGLPVGVILSDISARFQFVLIHPARQQKTSLTRRDLGNLIAAAGRRGRANGGAAVAPARQDSTRFSRSTTSGDAGLGNAAEDNSAAVLSWKP